MEMTPTVKQARRCGTCTLCCKLLTIPEFGNPSGQWCPHCVKGRGCTLYPDWPNECRTFFCGYLLWPELGEHWLPSRSKLVVAFKPDGMEIVIHVDPGVPNAWRAEPYYSGNPWAGRSRREGRPTRYLCRSGEGSSWSLPDREVDLGVVAEDERIAIQEEAGPGTRKRAIKVKVNDPRIV